MCDVPRPGTPPTFQPEQICQIIALACEPPSASGRPSTHWPQATLAAAAVEGGVVERISAHSVGRFLREVDLKPHRTRGWINPRKAERDSGSATCREPRSRLTAGALAGRLRHHPGRRRNGGSPWPVLVDDAVLDKLAADGFDPVYGARPLRREVERQLENPLAMRIVTGECPDGSRVRVQVREGQIAFEVRG